MIDDAFIAKVHAKCEDDCGCLIWQGGRGGSCFLPVLNRLSLRRQLFQAAFGEIPRGRCVSLICDNPLCLTLEHFTLRSKAAVIKHSYATTNMGLNRAIVSTRQARARAKLTLDQARAIRNSDEKLEVLAERYGVHMSMCSQIKRGTAWKEVSPFAGLGARA